MAILKNPDFWLGAKLLLAHVVPENKQTKNHQPPLENGLKVHILKFFSFVGS